MQVFLMPVPGTAATSFSLRGDALTVNGANFDMLALPVLGPVRLENGRCIVEYFDNGALASMQEVTGPADHVVEFVPVKVVAVVMADIAATAARDVADAAAAAMLAAADAAEAQRYTKITAMLAAYAAGTFL